MFGVKVDVTCKLRFATDGLRFESSVSMCYSGIVSRKSTKLDFLVAALIKLVVFACDISNAYPNAPCKEECWRAEDIEHGK